RSFMIGQTKLQWYRNIWGAGVLLLLWTSSRILSLTCPNVPETVRFNSRWGPNAWDSLTTPVRLIPNIPAAGSGCTIDSSSADKLLKFPCSPLSPKASDSGPPTCDRPQVVTIPPPNVFNQSSPLAKGCGALIPL